MSPSLPARPVEPTVLAGPGDLDSPPLTLGNRLLAALAASAPDDAAWLESQLERVSLAHGDVLAAAGEPLAHVYFPETAVISVISRMADGHAVEVGTVGNEGMVGVEVYLEAGAGVNEVVAQIPGNARRADGAGFLEGVHERRAIRRLLDRYTHAYLTQVAQTAACNRLHGLEVRCARWLLMTHDRVERAPRFPLTHEYLAIMLGVRRAGVTEAAGVLQASGLIRYTRGGIQVLDREGLEAAACECYGVVRRHFDRLLPDVAA
jgi:CRP-like cAMP-binding protein